MEEGSLEVPWWGFSNPHADRTITLPWRQHLPFRGPTIEGDMAANYTSHVQWNSQWATHALSQRSVHIVKPWTETTEPVKAYFLRLSQILQNYQKSIWHAKTDTKRGGGVGGTFKQEFFVTIVSVFNFSKWI